MAQRWLERVAHATAVLVTAAATFACGASENAGAGEGTDPGASAPSPAAAPADRQEGEGSVPDQPAAPVDTSVPAAARLHAEAARIDATKKETQYTHATKVDEATGTYDVDCSAFVDYAMRRAVPDAFATLVAASSARPVAADYVTLASRSSAPVGRWRAVARAIDLVPGDLVAWREPPDAKTTNTGHVMIVASTPAAAGAGEVFVPVLDATESGHGPTDARTVSKTTGVGQGTIALVVDAAGKPTSYRWSTSSGSPVVKTTIALAHLE